jgi:hypothetical protein
MTSAGKNCRRRMGRLLSVMARIRSSSRAARPAERRSVEVGRSDASQRSDPRAGRRPRTGQSRAAPLTEPGRRRSRPRRGARPQLGTRPSPPGSAEGAAGRRGRVGRPPTGRRSVPGSRGHATGRAESPDQAALPARRGRGTTRPMRSPLNLLRRSRARLRRAATGHLAGDRARARSPRRGVCGETRPGSRSRSCRRRVARGKDACGRPSDQLWTPLSSSPIRRATRRYSPWPIRSSGFSSPSAAFGLLIHTGM